MLFDTVVRYRKDMMLKYAPKLDLENNKKCKQKMAQNKQQRSKSRIVKSITTIEALSFQEQTIAFIS